MNHFFSVDYRMNRGNMHIELQGHFDTGAAKQFLSFLSAFYKGRGRVFVNTAKLTMLTEGGIKYFKDFFSHTPLIPHDFYIKGERGISMTPQGSRIILMKKKTDASPKKKKCSGNCKNCTCGHKKKKALVGFPV